MSTAAISRDNRASARRFLASLRDAGSLHITREQYWESYQSWARGGRGGWLRALDSGGTDVMTALCWYQHVHRPGSREWRPSIIVRAILAAVSRAEPTAEEPAQ